MRKLIMNLRMFDESGNGSAQPAAAAGAGNGGQTSAGGSYTFEQAEEIATARAERASRAALAAYFRQQGLSEDEVTAAIADFKAKQKEKQPDVETVTKERDAARKELEDYRNAEILRAAGVRQEDLDYVSFKVKGMVTDKLDFGKAAEKFLKENPRYAGSGYRVSGSTGTGDNNSSAGTGAASINDAIRRYARGR